VTDEETIEKMAEAIYYAFPPAPGKDGKTIPWFLGQHQGVWPLETVGEFCRHLARAAYSVVKDG
jgi:hypothetical protein